jgi:hypothetical protein
MFQVILSIALISIASVRGDFNASVKAFWTNTGFQQEARSTPHSLLVDISQRLLNTGHDIEAYYTPISYSKASSTISNSLKLNDNINEILEHRLEYCQPYEIFVIQTLISKPAYFSYNSCLSMCNIDSLWWFNVTTEDTINDNFNNQRIMTIELLPFINDTMIAQDILGLLTLHTMAIQQHIQLPIT